MATRLTTLKTGTNVPSAIGTYRSMLAHDLTTSATSSGTFVTMPDGDKCMTTSFYSERIDTQIAITGDVTFNVWWSCPTTATAKARTKLSKVTGAGSGAVETLICQQDSATLTPNNAQTKYTVSVTPPTPVTVAVGERLIMRMYVTPIAGSFGTGIITAWFGENAEAFGNTWVELTETIAFRADITKLILRRTTANGIGNFYDMLEARGSSAATTGVVNTTASGTQIQWTRTAGGTALEWISGRLHHPGWNFAVDANIFRSLVWAYESHDAANCTVRWKVYRRSALGAETLIYTYSHSATELPAGPVANSVVANAPLAGTLVPAVFEEDDRIVFRMYIINFGTMGGSRTCTAVYDHNVVDGDGDAFIQVVETPRFKAESDPPKSYRVVGGMTMGGVGN